MERRLEPEVMDGEAQSVAYANADFAEVDQAFVERFAATFPDFLTGHLLDMGCGPAAITWRLCKRLPGVRVTAVDASTVMMQLAQKTVQREGIENRVELVRGYFPGAIESDHQFDGVISNSLLHHLPNPMVLWTEIKRLMRPGAPVLVVDLMRPESEARAHAIVDDNSGDEPDILRIDFYNSLLAAFELREIEDQLVAAELHSLTAAQISDRHLAVWGLLPE